MQIADNVLRYHLRNVLWLCGGACGGKSTMSGILADKFGLMLYACDDRWIKQNRRGNRTAFVLLLLRYLRWLYRD